MELLNGVPFQINDTVNRRVLRIVPSEDGGATVLISSGDGQLERHTVGIELDGSQFAELIAHVRPLAEQHATTDAANRVAYGNEMRTHAMCAFATNDGINDRHPLTVHRVTCHMAPGLRVSDSGSVIALKKVWSKRFCEICEPLGPGTKRLNRALRRDDSTAWDEIEKRLRETEEEHRAAVIAANETARSEQ